MANVIKLKRGSGSDPTANDLVVGEVAVRTDTGKLFTKKDNGTIAEISGAGGSDIFINTLSASSGSGGGSATFNGTATRFTLSNPPDVSAQQLLVSVNGVVQKPNAGTSPSTGFAVDGNDIIFASAPETGASFFIVTYGTIGLGIPADGSVTTGKIADGAIVNADVNASAAIAGSKINPNFGSQDISTTGNLTLFGTNPTISFTDSNEDSDFRLFINAGKFKIQDASNSNADRFTVFTDGHIDIPGNLNCASGLDVTGEITATSHIDLPDDSRIKLGTSDDLQIYHNSNNNSSFIDNITGDLVIRGGGGNILINPVNNETAIYAIANDKVQLRFNNNTKLETTSSGVDVTGDLNLSASGNTALTINTGNNSGDNSSIFFADSADAQVGFINYDHGTNAMQFRVNTSERMHINSSGNVGIGESASIDARLHVNSGTDNTTLFIESTDGDVNLGMADNAGSCRLLQSAGDLHFRTGGNANAFGTGDNERMVIDSSGRVGIGVSSPATLLHLDASGGAVLRMQRIATNATNKLEFSHDGTDGTIDSTNDLILRTGGAIRAKIFDTGLFRTFGQGEFDGGIRLTDTRTIDFGDHADLQIGHSGSNSEIYHNGTGHLYIATQGSGEELYLSANDNVRIQTAGNEDAIKCLKDGSVLLYYNNDLRFYTNSDGIQVKNETLLRFKKETSTSGEVTAIQFEKDNPTNIVGRIRYDNGQTHYNTTSDYRLKENNVAITDGITRISQLKPYRFNFKVDPSKTVDGFFAHEVSSVVPEAISGEKDAVRDVLYNAQDVMDGTLPDGKSVGDVKESGVIEPQEIDQSKLVPLLTAALQEAIGKIETLETKVAALEAG